MSLDKQKFHIKVGKKGNLQFHDIEVFQNCISSNIGFKGYIQFHSTSNDSVIESFFNLYKWWLDMIAEDIGDSWETIDDTFCQMFLSEQKWSRILDKPITHVKSKNELSYKEWLDFFRKINVLCMNELNFINGNGETRLPIPNNLIGKI